MICNKCNHKLPDDSEFCQYCGSKIENVESVISNSINELSNSDIISNDASNNVCLKNNKNVQYTTSKKQRESTKMWAKIMNFLTRKRKIVILCTIIFASLFVAFAYPCIALETYREGMATHYFDTVETSETVIISGCGEKSCIYCNESFVVSEGYGLLSIPAYEFILELLQVIAPLTTFAGFFALVGVLLLIISYIYEKRRSRLSLTAYEDDEIIRYTRKV